MRLFISCVLICLLVHVPAYAAEPAVPELLDVLLENGSITQKQYDRLLRKTSGKDGDNVKVTTKGGIEVASYDGKYSFALSGRLMIDAAFYGADKNPLGDGTELRRARLEAEGTLYSNWEYELGVDFAGSDADIKDAYLSYVFTSPRKLTVGQFKEPFSLEELTSSKYITFMERGLPNAFAPGRSIGIGLHGWSDMWTYGIGLFGEAFDDDAANEGDEGWGAAARVTFAPWHSDRKVLHFGLALANRHPDDANEVQFDSRPESHITDVKYVNTDDIADVDNYCRYGSELAVVYGPFSMQAEYIHALVRRDLGLEDLNFSGWYGYGSWFITGESRNYKSKKGAFGRVKPINSFGALELAVRYSMLDLNDETIIEGGEEKNITFGLNWYVNAHVRLMANYILVDNDEFADDAGDLVNVDDDPRIFQMRLQVDF